MIIKNDEKKLSFWCKFFYSRSLKILLVGLMVDLLIITWLDGLLLIQLSLMVEG